MATAETTPAGSDLETILIVDDEEPIRRTFREWLTAAQLGCHILVAADAEEALRLANEHIIDLALLDWHLGAGEDGLQLLEDLFLFNEHVVAIMITGFAAQATPLDAMRHGVRDYLDKDHDLNREALLAAVQKQLDRIRPAKRERRLSTSLAFFREAVEHVLPLVQSAAALNDPLSLPEAIASLFRFLLRATSSRDGALLVRHYDAERDPPDQLRAYRASGETHDGVLAPWNRSIAGAVMSIGETYLMNRVDESRGSLELHPFEQGRQTLLAAPLLASASLQVVLELFDKQVNESRGGTSYTHEDRRLVAAAAEFGGEMLRSALGERQTHRLLFDAVEAALSASRTLTQTLQGTPEERRQEPPPPAVLEKMRASLDVPGTPVDAENTLRLVEAIRLLALRYGDPAVEHCIGLVENLLNLLDTASGRGEAGL
jgi:DNA-binding response OmpR family regulator